MKQSIAIVTLSITLLTLLVACGGNAAPTETPGLAQPTAQELKQAGQGLFDTFSASIKSKDAAALHAIFVSDIRERCTVEQMQASMISGESSFPNAEVKTVFLDLENPSSALMQLALRDQPNDGSVGLAAGFAFAFPFPMLMEDGAWRLSFPALVMVAEEACPFAEQSSQSGSVTATAQRIQATPQAALPSLAPPTGVQTISSGSGGGNGEYSATVLLKTEMPVDVLMDYYRNHVLQPNWELQNEMMDEGVAALTWTFLDEASQPGFGALVVAQSGEGQKRVRLWMGGSSAFQPFALPEGHEPPVPAATIPN